MLASNDFATCYMCQSLPMGGLKESGFGKFAGVEGLRDCCVAKVRSIKYNRVHTVTV